MFPSEGNIIIFNFYKFPTGLDRFIIMHNPPDVAKKRRKRYTPDVYARLTAELTKLIDQTPHLYPDRDEWDIEGEWKASGDIHFIDATYMHSFAQYAPFDCRSIKLVNFGRPAVRISFYEKHKFWILKNADLTIEEKKKWVTDYLNNLTIKAEILQDKSKMLQGEKLSHNKGVIASHYEQIDTWKLVLNNIEQYELALSNYHRMHYYTQINYKYWISQEDATLANCQEHLLNPQRDRDGNINEMRHNVVFVDSTDILRQHPYQNKEADKFLARFTMKTELGRTEIFARLRPDLETLATFSNIDAVSRFPTQTGKQPKNDQSDFGPLFS